MAVLLLAGSHWLQALGKPPEAGLLGPEPLCQVAALQGAGQALVQAQGKLQAYAPTAWLVHAVLLGVGMRCGHGCGHCQTVEKPPAGLAVCAMLQLRA